MPVIQIDTKSISEAFSLDEASVNSLMDFTIKELTGRFAQEWEIEASRTLKSGRQQYINSIVVVDEGFAKGAVMLVGELPNMIEMGVPSFDMKPGLLDGPNAKVGKNGKKYNTVPWALGSPRALAENFNGGILPTEVYDIIVSKPVDTATGKTSGLTKDELPKAFKEPQKKSIKMPEAKSFSDYQHKHSIYEGAFKQVDSTTGQSSFKSFRRVSENSDPSAWIYPGIEAKNISDKALNNFDIPSEVGRIIDQFLDKL